MLRKGVIALTVCVAVARSEEALQAAQAVAQEIAFVRNEPTPNPWCIASHCAAQAGKCSLDKDCRSALECIARCHAADPKEMNQTCIFQCNSDYENDVYDNLIYCMFNENDCAGTKKDFDEWKACRSIDVVAPMTEYRGAPLTKEVARDLLLRGTGKLGDWMVAMGLSGAYDCFDCQFLYWGEKLDKSLFYTANYKIHKSNGGIRWNTAAYVASEWKTGLGRYSVNASDYGGLAHEEDWRLLAADESSNPQWIAVYYCGAAAGVGEAYEGAFILTTDGALPKDPKDMERIAAVYKKAGLKLACKTDNTNCTGHPGPPAPQAEIVV